MNTVPSVEKLRCDIPSWRLVSRPTHTTKYQIKRNKLWFMKMSFFARRNFRPKCNLLVPRGVQFHDFKYTYYIMVLCEPYPVYLYIVHHHMGIIRWNAASGGRGVWVILCAPSTLDSLSTIRGAPPFTVCSAWPICMWNGISGPAIQSARECPPCLFLVLLWYFCI